MFSGYIAQPCMQVYWLICVGCLYCVHSVGVVPVAASPGYPGLAGLSDRPPFSAEEKEAARQPDQPQDSEGESKSGQRD